LVVCRIVLKCLKACRTMSLRHFRLLKNKHLIIIIKRFYTAQYFHKVECANYQKVTQPTGIIVAKKTALPKTVCLYKPK
jgi:hypothetical protein